MRLVHTDQQFRSLRVLLCGLATLASAVALLGAPAAASAAGLSISTFAGTGAACASAVGVPPTCGDGAAASAAELNGPGGVASDAAGNVFVADTADNEIRMISPLGTITTVAGTGAQCMKVGSCGDGGPAISARLSGPRGLAVDSAGTVYVADTGDNEIRAFTVGGSIMKLAGGSACSSPPSCGDGGPAVNASLNSPAGVAVAAGVVYVADTGDNEIRSVTAGNITRIAGTGTMCSTSNDVEKPTCGDGGPPTRAQLATPQGIAVDSVGDVWAADTGDHEIRRFAPGAAISTVAGSGTPCTTAAATRPTCGDGGAATSAQLNSPQGVAIDGTGNLYVADTNDAEVRFVAATGAISTVAGIGSPCPGSTTSCGDGDATSAQLNLPAGVSVESAERIFIADTADHKVRVLAPPAAGPGPGTGTAPGIVLAPALVPPAAMIGSPALGSVFTLYHGVDLSFACREGAGGPGLQSCTACESIRAFGPRAACTAESVLATRVRLDTASVGVHTYVITARSQDGLSTGVSFPYTVQRFRPLVYAPPALLALASRPCVMYPCRANPGLHVGWENSLTGLAATWCANYGCQNRMNLLPVNGFDDNLFPFNPDWAGFVLTGHPPFAQQECKQFLSANPADWGPFCTTYQVRTDDARHGSGTICNGGRDPRSAFHGHINWEPATYEGKLQWFEHSGPGTDDDYSLDLHTLNLDGVTGDNNGGNAVHIEFDSDETIDHFDSSNWWRAFHNAVDLSDSAAHSRIDGDLAEVTGMVGIDAAHTPAAELHPVYAIAVQTNRASALSGHRDQWAIFARNWGNEGYCSSRDHPIPAGPITVRIPWLNGARGVDLAQQPRAATGVRNIGSFFDAMNVAHPGITERVIPGEGVLLTFDLSTSPSQQPEYWGTIDLQWTFAPRHFPVAGLPAGSPGNRAPTPVVSKAAEGEMDVEAGVDALVRRLPAKVRAALLRSIPPRLIVSRKPRRVRITMRPAPTAPLLKPGALFQLSRTDGTLLRRSSTQLHALCLAYRNRLPGLARVCPRSRKKP